MRNILFILIFIFALTIFAVAEEVVFCDSISLRETDWSENFTLEKFDSNLGTLQAVDIFVEVNLSQLVRAENTGPGNYTLNSTAESVLTLHLPDAQEMKADASQVIFSKLRPFDGLEDFSGSSGISLEKVASGNRTVYPIEDISGFVAGTEGENIVLNGVMECTQNMTASGSASSQIWTGAGADVCIHYRYDTGAS